MGMTLSAAIVWGIKMPHYGEVDLFDSDKEMPEWDDEYLESLYAPQNAPYQERYECRKGCGIELEYCSWGEDLPVFAVAGEVASGWDEGVIELKPEELIVRPDWEANMQEFLYRANLKQYNPEKDYTPGWHVIYRYW